MEAHAIKWISYYGKKLGAVNLSFFEKVKRFDYCLVLDEYGSDKSAKAQMCIIDAVNRKQAPNILLICEKHLMHSWYRSIVTQCGVDLKMITGSSRAITYFNADMSNMYIISEEALRSDSGVIKEFAEAGLHWDLVIIDAGFKSTGVDCALYTEHLGAKTEKLVVFSPIPTAYDQNYDALKGMVKTLLLDSEKAASADDLQINEELIGFNPDNPVIRYFDKDVYSGEVSRKVNVLEYEFDKDFISNSRRLIDIKTGLPLYIHGGNIFEEYGVEAKRIYTKPIYTIPDVNDLRAVDKKLDCFLNKLDEILKDAGNKVIIYCVSGSTISYLEKALTAMYQSSIQLRIDRGDIFNTGYNDFTSLSGANARVVISVDRVGSINPVMKQFTHVVNYELPADPIILDQRITRHARTDDNSVEYFLFSDKNGLFDTRMLSKVLFGKIYGALISGVPGRSLLFDLPNALQLTINCIRDLQYVCGYTGEVSGSRDVIIQFKSDYNIPPEADIMTAIKCHEYTDKKLYKIYRAFGIESKIRDNSTDEKTLKSLLAPVFESCKNSLLYLDEDGKITPINGEKLSAKSNSKQFYEYKESCKQNEMYLGLEQAKKMVAEYAKTGRTSQIRLDVSQLSDALKMPVLHSCWRYLTDEGLLQDSFKQFMKNYNEGVM